MDKKKYDERIEFLSNKYKTSKKALKKDFILSALKYKASFTDYLRLKMYTLKENERASMITTGFNEELIKKCNFNVEANKTFNNRTLFYDKFHKYLGRDYITLNNNVGEFTLFVKNHPIFVAKRNYDSSFKVIDSTNKNVKKLYQKLIDNGYFIVEEKIVQNESLAVLNPDTVNSIRFVTLNGNIIFAFLCICNGGVNNSFDNGGLVSPINLETGIADYMAVNKDGEIFDRHPITNELILWFSVIKWPRIKRFVSQLVDEVKDVQYVAWNITINEKDPVLIGATCRPRCDIYDLPDHRSTNEGSLKRIKEMMKEDVKDEVNNSNRS